MPGFVLKRVVNGSIETAIEAIRKPVLQVMRGQYSPWLLVGSLARVKLIELRWHRTGAARRDGAGRPRR